MKGVINYLYHNNITEKTLRHLTRSNENNKYNIKTKYMTLG